MAGDSEYAVPRDVTDSIASTKALDSTSDIYDDISITIGDGKQSFTRANHEEFTNVTNVAYESAEKTSFSIKLMWLTNHLNIIS